MTTLACNRKEMAGDLQLSVGDAVKMRGGSKIFKIKAHQMLYEEDFIIGFCGSSAASLDVLDYFSNPEVYKQMPKTKGLQGLVLTQSGNIFIFDSPERWIEVDEEFAAMGSGATFALGAMHSGASPSEAIEAASKCDVWTGFGVTVLTL